MNSKEFIRRYEEVQNFKMFGNTRLEYAYIADNQKGVVDWDINDLDIAIIDIEVGSENGFPDPATASEPVTAIAIKKLNKRFSVYGCGKFTILVMMLTILSVRMNIHYLNPF